jgi:hypothetical protein
MQPFPQELAAREVQQEQMPVLVVLVVLVAL